MDCTKGATIQYHRDNLIVLYVQCRSFVQCLCSLWSSLFCSFAQDCLLWWNRWGEFKCECASANYICTQKLADGRSHHFLGWVFRSVPSWFEVFTHSSSKCRKFLNLNKGGGHNYFIFLTTSLLYVQETEAKLSPSWNPKIICEPHPQFTEPVSSTTPFEPMQVGSLSGKIELSLTLKHNLAMPGAKVN